MQHVAGIWYVGHGKQMQTPLLSCPFRAIAMFWLGGIVCDLILPGKVPHAFLDMIHSEGKRLSDELASNKKLNGRGGAVMLPMTSPANTKCSKPVFSSSDRSSCGRSGHVHFLMLVVRTSSSRWSTCVVCSLWWARLFPGRLLWARVAGGSGHCTRLSRF